MTETTSILDREVGMGQCEGEHPEGGECLEPLEHPVSVCPTCGTPAVWVKNVESAQRKRRLSPTDPLGREMLKEMGINNFQDAGQLRQWKEFIKTIPGSQIRATWESCKTNMRRYGWLKYTLNKLNWLIENGKVDEPEPEPGEGYVEWK